MPFSLFLKKKQQNLILSSAQNIRGALWFDTAENEIEPGVVMAWCL